MRKFPPYKTYKGKIKLDLGSADKTASGYIGIDNRDCGQDMIWDITDGLPFPDGTVDEVYSSHFLEHLSDDQATDLLHEVYRVLKPKGVFRSRLPHQTHPTAYYCGHKTFWNEAKVEAITRIEGLEKFLITLNEQRGAELYFELKKLK